MRIDCALCGREKDELYLQIIDNQWVCKSGRCYTDPIRENTKVLIGSGEKDES